jgi:crotonobetainyl-CoA:carnitine CoA-transferase CaiB-like acyl-CoA transferase
MHGALEDIRVIDLSRHLSGPYAGAILADFGAEVIRVERPGGDEDRHFGYEAPSGDTWSFANRSRNKKAVTINLRHPQGKSILDELIKRSDVVLENFASRDKKKLGLDYDSLKKINPRIILASVSAYGLTGPNAQRVGFDPIAQAESGSMSLNGFPGNPPTRAGVPWVDYSTAIYAAFGIVMALRHRDRTGKGQVLDICLADVAAALVAVHGIFTEFEKEGIERPQMGNMSPYAYANTFQAEDGWVFISLTRDGIWKRFLKTAEMESLEQDPRFSSDEQRARNRDELDKIITPWVKKKTVEEIITTLEKAFVPCARVNTIKQAFHEKQLWDREVLLNMEHERNGKMATLGVVVKCSETPGAVKRGMPLVGQHNREIFQELLGYQDEDLNEFEREGVI